MFSPFGNVGYSESNLEHYDFRVSFAADYNNNNNFIIPPDGDGRGVDNTGEWGTDIAIKALGGLFLYGEYYWRNLETARGREHAADGRDGAGQLALRRPLRNRGSVLLHQPQQDRDDRNIQEWAGGLNWYFNKHFWKLQADYSVLKNERREQLGRTAAGQEQGLPTSGPADVLSRRSFT